MALSSITAQGATAGPTVRNTLENVSGVSKVEAYLDAGTVTVTFAPFKTNPMQLIKAIADAGFPSKVKP